MSPYFASCLRSFGRSDQESGSGGCRTASEAHGFELPQGRDGLVHVGVETVPQDADGGLLRVAHLDGAGGGEDDVGDGIEDVGRELFVEHLAVVDDGGGG